MKPTHAQLVNLLREIVRASPQVQPLLIERARHVLCLRDDATSAPAVTGEAAQHAETLREMAERIAHVIRMKAHAPTGQVADGDVMLAASRAACLAGAEALAAPPAAGAPPALVALDIPALLQEAKRFGRLAEQFVGPMPPTWTKRRAERDEAVHALRDAEKLLIGLVEKQRAWSPAPAPVAPPAETKEEQNNMGAVAQSGRALGAPRSAMNGQRVDVGSNPTGPHLSPAPPAEEQTELAHLETDHGAPPAVAGGDAPEMVVFEKPHGRCSAVMTHRGTEFKCQGFVSHSGSHRWRRRQEGQ